MFCTPPATTRSLRAAHHRLRREVERLLRRAALAIDRGAGTSSGSPAASQQVRAMSPACGPIVSTQPKITSSTAAGSKPVRCDQRALITCAPRSAGCTAGQRAAAPADRCADGVDDERLGHEPPPTFEVRCYSTQTQVSCHERGAHMTANANPTSLRAVRAQIDHPIVDADAHQLEVLAVLLDFIREVGGPDMPDTLHRLHDEPAAHVPRDARRAARSTHRRAGVVADAHREHARPRDDGAARATCTSASTRSASTSRSCTRASASRSSRFPAWPTTSCARAWRVRFNLYNAEMFGPLADRMTPAGGDPDAHARRGDRRARVRRNELGLKAFVFAGDVLRPVPQFAREHPDLARVGALPGLLRHRQPATTTTRSGRSASSSASRPRSTRARSGRAAARSVDAPPVQPDRRLRRGRRGDREVAVLRRRHRAASRTCASASSRAASPGARASTAACSTTGRSATARRSCTSTRSSSTRRCFAELIDELRHTNGEGDPRPARAGLAVGRPPRGARRLARVRDHERRGRSPQLFVPPFYFGCEGDDRMVAARVRHASSTRSARASTPMFGSDIGHFDVDDMREVIPKAHELVDEGLMTTPTSATSRSPTRCGCTAA